MSFTAINASHLTARLTRSFIRCLVRLPFFNSLTPADQDQVIADGQDFKP